ncbi:hypothetical protein BGX23_005938 [Mortierella sp. AD031]|nr:hypothetical protein BGX23_005938 [Mortierella sp. AD031]
MDDHSQRQAHLPHHSSSSRLDHPPHHPHLQAHYRHQQDIHGPLSAGVVEGRRAFSFHSSLRSTPLSFSTPAPPPSANLSVADILDKYQDANSDFLVSILNAKAKEDERKAEEERYKTEKIKLQSKQLELELAKERRRGVSPSPARPGYAPEPSSGHFSSSSNSYYSTNNSSNNNNNNSAYSPYPSGDGPRSHQPNGNGNHRDHHTTHGSQDAQDYVPSPVRQDMHAMLPSPQSRPPVLKINTSVRQYVPQPHSSQRLPPSPLATLPPLPATTPSKSNGRHYNLPPLSTSSAQSSPIGVVDYQSHIPPPITPKDDLSPTSALSPTNNMKRKSIHHDAVMDAVRAKVFRNASASANGQNQQQKKSSANDSSEREQSRRKLHHGPTSPEATKRPTELPQPMSAPNSGPTSASTDSSKQRQQQQEQDEYRPIKLEGPLLSSLPLTTSPHSPSPGNVDNNNNRDLNHGASRSGSGSPTSANPSNSRRTSGKSRISLSASTSAEGKETVEGVSG